MQSEVHQQHCILEQLPNVSIIRQNRKQELCRGLNPRTCLPKIFSRIRYYSAPFEAYFRNEVHGIGDLLLRRIVRDQKHVRLHYSAYCILLYEQLRHLVMHLVQYVQVVIVQQSEVLVQTSLLDLQTVLE